MTPLAMPTARPTARPARIPATGETDDAVVQRDRTGQPVDRPDRQVDAAGDEDERPGAGDDDDPGLLVEDVGQVAEAQEGRADDREHDEGDEERDEDPAPARRCRPIRCVSGAAVGSAPRPCSALMRRSSRSCRTPRSRSPPRSCPVPDSSATSRPARMTSTRCARPEDLLDLVRDEQDRHAVGGQANEHVVDVALRADVDPARRLVGDEDARVDEQGPGEQQLLLVAARQRRRRAPRAATTRSRARARRGPAHAPRRGARTQPLEAPQAGQADVLPDRTPQDQPVVLARLRDQRDARAIEAAGRPAGRVPATLDRAGRRRARRRRSPGPAPSARRRPARPARRSRRRAGSATRPSTPGADRPSTARTTGASGGGGCLSG